MLFSSKWWKRFFKEGSRKEKRGEEVRMRHFQCLCVVSQFCFPRQHQSPVEVEAGAIVLTGTGHLACRMRCMSLQLSLAGSKEHGVHFGCARFQAPQLWQNAGEVGRRWWLQVDPIQVPVVRSDAEKWTPKKMLESLSLERSHSELSCEQTGICLGSSTFKNGPPDMTAPELPSTS